MIGKGYVTTMARYNAWQNDWLLAAAGRLEPAEREADRGLFFGSIPRTLNHLLWADQMWLHRFAATPLPVSPDIRRSTEAWPEWDGLVAERRRFDRVIRDWAEALDPEWLAGDLTWYSGSAKQEVTRPRALLVTHFFNHQTHHRGQVHAALTGLGIVTEVTDLPFLPEPA